jgi:hypothetical protein
MTPCRQENSGSTPEQLAASYQKLNSLRKLRKITVFIPEEFFATDTYFGLTQVTFRQ